MSAAPQPTLARPHRPVVPHFCHACGVRDDDRPRRSFVYRRDAAFCLGCWETVPGAAIRQVMQEVALRGVPL